MRTLLTMSPAALRASALLWYLRGFAVSGRGFNGESIELDDSPATRSLLVAEFDRQWGDHERTS